MTATNWKNVNNWHWVEKNCLAWTQSYLKDRIAPLQVDGDNGLRVVAKNLASAEGDIYVNVRKGKTIYIFDMEVAIDWEGEIGDIKATGQIKFTDVTHDDDPADYPVEVTCNDETPAKRPIVDAVKKLLRKHIDAVFKQLPKDLLAEHGPSLLVPSTKTEGQNAAATASVKKELNGTPASSANVSSTSPVLVCSINFKSEFKATAQDVYLALTDPQRLQAWTCDRVEFNDVPGGHFSLMNGNVTGDVLECKPGERLVMKWRLKQWSEGHYSRVEIDFKQGSDTTTIHIKQTELPKSEELIMKENWERMFFKRIKNTFGYLL